MKLASDEGSAIVLVPETEADHKALRKVIDRELDRLNEGMELCHFSLCNIKYGGADGWFRGYKLVINPHGPARQTDYLFRVLQETGGLSVDCEEVKG
jgi:hypothetical protein